MVTFRWITQGAEFALRARIHRIACSGSPVQQIFVRLDEGRLLLRVELALYRLRLVMLHAQPVQQRDQPRPTLVFDAQFGCDPGANRTRRARQGRGDPGDQPGLLLVVEAAGAVFVAEARKAIDPVSLIQQTSGLDRIIV